MKQLIYLLVSALLCLTLLSGCKDTDAAAKKEAEQEQDLIRSMQKEDGMQPGAKVDSFRNEDGNVQVTYENPDGSGGGGVALD